MRLQVQYFNSEELFSDAQSQFSKGGFLVRVNSATRPSLYSRACLDLYSPAGEVHLVGEVVLHAPGLGVALAFDATHPGLQALLRSARRQPFQGGPARHREVSPVRYDGDLEISH